LAPRSVAAASWLLALALAPGSKVQPQARAQPWRAATKAKVAVCF
jgi:hypothetical protein